MDLVFQFVRAKQNFDWILRIAIIVLDGALMSTKKQFAVSFDNCG